MIALSGGEARPVTNISTGVSAFIWSPRGTHFAFTSSVFPDCPTDENNKKKMDEQEANPVKARLYNQLLYRHWDKWWDGTRSHLFLVPVSGGKALDLAPGDYDTPPIALGSDRDFAFSPDGSEIALVRNTDPEFKLGLGTNNDIFVRPVSGGEIVRITSSKANDNQPAYSPDGRFIAYHAMARPGFEADKYGLIVYDRSAKTVQNLTASLDYSVQEVLWAPDGSAVYFNAEEKGRMAVFRVTLADKKAEKILEGHYVNALSITPDGKRLIFLKQAVDCPADIWSSDLASRKLTRLTDMNRDLLSRLDLPPAEEFWFEGGGKDKVHGFLLKPPFFDPKKKYPLVLLIHGGPQGAWSDNFHYRWNAQMFASPGYVVAMINFHGSTGYGQAFTDSISGDWGGKPYEDIITGLGYLHGGYPFIDLSRNAAAGASYGGYMIDWIEGHTDVFKCLVAHSGVFDLRSMYGATEELWFPEWEYRGTPWTSPEQYQKWSPSSYVKNFQTPCLVIHSANDLRVPLEQGLQFFTSLQRMNVPSKFLYFPDETHFINKPRNAELWWKTVLDWLASYLK
jgi:dipeptidyl aminopeptidase/acylaminoacyl peptidase